VVHERAEGRAYAGAVSDRSSTPGRTLGRDLGVGAGVGVFSGALGVGGGILLVPYLVLVRGVGQKVAQATSLVMIMFAALAGAARYAASDAVAWAPVAAILTGGLTGALIGATVVQRTSDRRLQGAFGLLVLLVGLRLLWPVADTVTSASALPAMTPGLAVGYAAAGLAMGVLSALLGVGGGIILVPILVGLFGYGQQVANGTALAVMVPVALLGAVRLTRPGLTDWSQGTRFGLAAILGALLGASLALALSGTAVRIAFAVFLIVIGAQMLRTAITASRGRGSN
jgi:uncharacterized membrane protein YfcA